MHNGQPLRPHEDGAGVDSAGALAALEKAPILMTSLQRTAFVVVLTLITGAMPIRAADDVGAEMSAARPDGKTLPWVLEPRAEPCADEGRQDEREAEDGGEENRQGPQTTQRSVSDRHGEHLRWDDERRPQPVAVPRQQPDDE